MKTKIWKCVALVLALMCILTFPIGVSAAAQGTNGDEMQVATPEKLEIHLGQEWAGVTFELTTDYGKYPDPIPVGEDGVLRLEIGGSSSYILSCLSSEAEAPAPTETAPEESTPADAPTVNKDELVDIEDVTPTEPTEETNTVAGIPVVVIHLRQLLIHESDGFISIGSVECILRVFACEKFILPLRLEVDRGI